MPDHRSCHPSGREVTCMVTSAASCQAPGPALPMPGRTQPHHRHMHHGGDIMKLYFDDEDFDGQLQRSIGKADSGMANVGECLAIAGQITPGDRDSWYRAWSGFATHLAEKGQAALTAGHRVSARGLLLRASEYFRQAFFYHRDNLDGDELQTAYASSVRA